MNREHLARFTMTDGKVIDMHKENSDVIIKAEGCHEITHQNATGQQTLDWCALFESLCAKAEYPEGGLIESGQG